MNYYWKIKEIAREKKITLKEVHEEFDKRMNKSTTYQNFSNRLNKETFSFSEFAVIADIIGCEIVIKEKEDI